MDNLDPWKLADELNVYQIAALLAGYSPTNASTNSENPQYLHDVEGYLVSIKNAVMRKRIGAHILYEVNDFENIIDWYNTLVEIAQLRLWLREHGVLDCFFYHDDEKAPVDIDPRSEFYALKLAAALRAWSEVTANPTLLNGKTPKQALQIWLRQHANEYGLTKDDGKPNEQGIEEICKVANWKPGGGASPTPTALSEPTHELPKKGGRVPLRLVDRL